MDSRRLFSPSPPSPSEPHPLHCKQGAMEERILRGKCGVRLKARQDEAGGVLLKEGEWDLRRYEVQGFGGGYTERKGR